MTENMKRLVRRSKKTVVTIGPLVDVAQTKGSSK